MSCKIIRVTSKYFCAGFAIEHGRVTSCAPILRKYFAGKTIEQARHIAKQLKQKHKWEFENVRPYIE